MKKETKQLLKKNNENEKNILEENDEIWIGVPGIFHEREKMAANAFGFTHFRRIADVDIELEEEERNTYEDFGYWCRQIPNPKV